MIDRLLHLEPDALVIEDLTWVGRADLVRRARSLNVRVAALPVAGLFETKQEILRAAGQATGVSGLVHRYLAWGEATAQVLLEAGVMSAEQLRAVGSPRFDLYREPYLALMQSRDDFLRLYDFDRPAAPLIVWATNTPQFARGYARELKARVERTLIPEAEAREELTEEATQFQHHSRAVAELARRHPDWNFIIKVHPLEPVDHYRPLAAEHRNIRIAFEAPIREFLYHADVLLQRGCTTAAEAWIARQARARARDRGVHPALGAARVYRRQPSGPEVDEAEDAIRDISAGPHGVPQLAARAAFAREYRCDGRASERCAREIDTLVTAPPTGMTKPGAHRS